MTASDVRARERPMFTQVGLAGIVGGVLALLGYVLLQATLSGGGPNFESLEDAKDGAARIWLAGFATGVGYLLLTAPLLFLFRAARDRSERVKAQMVGLVVLGPVLLALSAPIIAAGTQSAADTYLDGDVTPTLSAGEAKEECVEERDDDAEQFGEDHAASGGKSALAVCEEERVEEDLASEAISDTGLLTVGQFVGLAGTFALLFSLLYTGLWSMRTGLLTRFWGSLGMAVGIASLFGLAPFAFIWFIYLGLLLTGWLPGPRPPAWEAGEAVPWPTPGEKAAAELEPEDGSAIDVESTEVDPDDPDDPDGGDGPYGSERRKRKRRE